MQHPDDGPARLLQGPPGPTQATPLYLAEPPRRRSAGMRRRVLVFFSVFALCAAASLAYTFLRPAIYLASARLQVVPQGALPKGARPDLSVEGTIELELLQNVLYVGRPVHGQSESTVGIFKLVKAGREAIRVPVKLGRSSVNTIEILQGLELGDGVILSDMSQWDAHDRVRLD